MGRLKSRLAKERHDRELHAHLAQAERSLGKAGDVCARIVRREGRYGGAVPKRAQEALRIIRKAVGMINSLGYLTPAIDMEDFDLAPEEVKTQRARERREARRQAQQQIIEA